MSTTDTQSADDVRESDHRVLPFYEAELKDRGDGDFWAWAASEPAGCRVLEVGAGTGTRRASWRGRRGGWRLSMSRRR